MATKLKRKQRREEEQRVRAAREAAAAPPPPPIAAGFEVVAEVPDAHETDDESMRSAPESGSD